jgi:hypothetical protein
MGILPGGLWITYLAVRGSYQCSTAAAASLDSQISSPMTNTTSAIITAKRSVIGYVMARGSLVSFNTYVVFFEAAAVLEDMADHDRPE